MNNKAERKFRVTRRELLGSGVLAILFYAGIFYAIFPNFPTKLTGWLALIILSPVFFVAFARLFPGESTKYLNLRETIYALGMIIFFIFLIYINDICGNCIGKHY